MKNILLGIVTMLVLGGIVYSINNGSTITVDNTVIAATSTPSVEQTPVDPLEEARQELSKITEALNEEVVSIEAEKTALTAEIEALHQRLEEIRKLRTSF